MIPELNQHTLARVLIIQLRIDYVYSFMWPELEILSWSRNSVKCKYKGKKYSFTYVISKRIVKYAIEYFSGKRHYFGKGVSL